MSKRDPRIDPRPGDILRKGDREIMVHIVKDGKVYFGGTATLGGGHISLERFRNDAKDAEVREFPEVK